jgi:hypothetical protein
MAQNTERLSRLMRISWAIQQKNKRITRSKALQSAWALFNNEDVAVFYLVRKLNHNKPVAQKVNNQFSLFNTTN